LKAQLFASLYKLYYQPEVMEAMNTLRIWYEVFADHPADAEESGKERKEGTAWGERPERICRLFNWAKKTDDQKKRPLLPHAKVFGEQRERGTDLGKLLDQRRRLVKSYSSQVWRAHKAGFLDEGDLRLLIDVNHAAFLVQIVLPMDRAVNSECDSKRVPEGPMGKQLKKWYQELECQEPPKAPGWPRHRVIKEYELMLSQRRHIKDSESQ